MIRSSRPIQYTELRLQKLHSVAAGMPPSARFASLRIMTGTILGGILGFYVMHRLEISYKEKMKERLEKYELELKLRDQQQQQEQQQITAEILPDS